MNLEELTALYDFSDRTVVVTGGAGVLGSEIACALVGFNANVVHLDRDQELAEKAIERFPKVVKGRVAHIYGDVLDAETLFQAQDTIENEFGVVDILINASSRVSVFDDLTTNPVMPTCPEPVEGSVGWL